MQRSLDPCRPSHSAATAVMYSDCTAPRLATELKGWRILGWSSRHSTNPSPPSWNHLDSWTHRFWTTDLHRFLFLIYLYIVRDLYLCIYINKYIYIYWHIHIYIYLYIYTLSLQYISITVMVQCQPWINEPCLSWLEWLHVVYLQ